jgi:ankyrin repeat protein
MYYHGVLLDMCRKAWQSYRGASRIRQWLNENEDNQELLRVEANHQSYADSMTSLHHLVRCAEPPFDLVIRLLQLAPETITSQDAYGKLPLHYIASYHVPPGVIKFIIFAYPKAAEIKDAEGCLPLHRAIHCEASPDVIKILIDAYPKATEIEDNYGHLPIHIAINSKASPEAIKVLLDANPAVSEIEDCGRLPIHSALYYKASPDVIKLILDANPKVAEIPDKDGQLPIHIACDKYYNGRDLLDKLDILLLAYPESIDVESEMGMLPSDHLKKSLKPYDYDDNSIDQSDLDENFVEIISSDDENLFMLHETINSGYSTYLVKLLLQVFPESCMRRDDEGMVPLHIAINNEAPPDVVQMILDENPMVTEIAYDGRLPIHSALYYKAHPYVIKMILDANPKVAKILDRNGKLPIHIACEKFNDGRDLLEKLDLLLLAYPESISVESANDMLPSDYLKSSLKPYDSGDNLIELSDLDEDFVEMMASDADENLFMIHDTIISQYSTCLLKLLLQVFPESSTTQDDEGMVPLHYACTSNAPNFPEYVVALLASDSKDSIKVHDNQGRTPLQLLRSKVSTLDVNNMLALHHLAASSKTLTEKSLQLLVGTYPESIMASDNCGMLPFHYACLNQDLSLEALIFFISLSPEVILFHPESHQNVKSKSGKK